MDTSSGRVLTDQALVSDQAASRLAPSGFDPSRSFMVKRWHVSVDGYGSGFYEAATRGQALADAWRCDAFSHLTFGQFMAIARCWRERELPARFGDPITVNGEPAFFIEHNRQYVRFAYPGEVRGLTAHPYEVLPVAYRPDTYRDRDNDGSPEGRDA